MLFVHSILVTIKLHVILIAYYFIIVDFKCVLSVVDYNDCCLLTMVLAFIRKGLF